MKNLAELYVTPVGAPCKQNLKILSKIALAPPKAADGRSRRRGLILFLVTVKPAVHVSGAWDSTNRVRALLESTNPVLLA